MASRRAAHLAAALRHLANQLESGEVAISSDLPPANCGVRKVTPKVDGRGRIDLTISVEPLTPRITDLTGEWRELQHANVFGALEVRS
jgi:hypothetical protein